MLFPEERVNQGLFVPTPSKVQQEVYHELYKRCWNDNRFEGPGFELRTGRCSQDIIFLGAKGEKICYEIDCEDYHNKEADKKRDYFLKLEFGWKIYRVNVKHIDSFGEEQIAEMIFQHLMKQLGFESGIILPGIINSYQAEKGNNKHLH
ncbi:hypothetical protein [Ferdinandcohnia sp. Marseille-Q9671]